MSRRRSQLEITLCVLSTVRDGVHKPTLIMYNAHMSWAPLQKKLAYLVDQGLLNVETVNNKRRYTILDKGIKVLEFFKQAEVPLSFYY